MAKTKTNTDDIIEKKESSPVATTSLIISCVAMLAASVFCIAEIMDYRQGLASTSDTPGMETANDDIKALEALISDIVANQVVTEEDESGVESEGMDEGDETFDEALETDEGPGLDEDEADSF